MSKLLPKPSHSRLLSSEVCERNDSTQLDQPFLQTKIEKCETERDFISSPGMDKCKQKYTQTKQNQNNWTAEDTDFRLLEAGVVESKTKGNLFASLRLFQYIIILTATPHSRKKSSGDHL